MFINQSFNEGVNPNLLKWAIIKPRLKNSISNKNNYGRITLLPTTSNIFEKKPCDQPSVKNIYFFSEYRYS